MRGRKLDFDEEPSALNKLIGYSREGENKKLSLEKRVVFEYIVRTCEVPHDFEANHKYGPKSGLSYEERLINAFCYALFPISSTAQELRPRIRTLVARRRWKDASEVVSTTAL